jgi:glycosyltransferase involved in cell wall biosynthesis
LLASISGGPPATGAALEQVTVSPRFSIVVAVRNAAHLLPAALDALQRQSFGDFEIVVVDGQSTDGTLDLLTQASKTLPIKLVSEPDKGIADAYAKGYRRAIGELVIASSADERLYPEALATANLWFAQAPDAVVCCGRADMMDAAGAIARGHVNTTFDLAAHLTCEVVLPISASVFNRARLGSDFWYDNSRPSCPDYEFWGRLAFKYPKESFRLFEDGIVAALATRDSMSFRTESFEVFVQDKTAHLDGLLARFAPAERRERLRGRSVAGIHMWAAEQLFAMEPGHPNILKHCTEAARSDATYQRISEFLVRSDLGRIDSENGAVIAFPTAPGPTASVVAAVPFVIPSYWADAKCLSDDPQVIRTSANGWGYSAIAQAPADISTEGLLWLRLDVEVIGGTVGIARLQDNTLRGERLIDASQGRQTLHVALHEGRDTGVIIRSGPQGGAVIKVLNSTFLIDEAPQGTRSGCALVRRVWDRMSAYWAG